MAEDLRVRERVTRGGRGVKMSTGSGLDRFDAKEGGGVAVFNDEGSEIFNTSSSVGVAG